MDNIFNGIPWCAWGQSTNQEPWMFPRNGILRWGQTIAAGLPLKDLACSFFWFFLPPEGILVQYQKEYKVPGQCSQSNTPSWLLIKARIFHQQNWKESLKIAFSLVERSRFFHGENPGFMWIWFYYEHHSTHRIQSLQMRILLWLIHISMEKKSKWMNLGQRIFRWKLNRKWKILTYFLIEESVNGVLIGKKLNSLEQILSKILSFFY